MTASTDQPTNPGLLRCDPVGLAEVSELLRIRRATLDQIRWRGGENALPVPRWEVGGWPAWEKVLDIAPWAVRTDRWPEGLAVPVDSEGRCKGCEPSGLQEIAYRLRMKRDTLDHIQHRGGAGALPDPRWTVGGRPAWDFPTDIVPWARATGRWPTRGPRPARAIKATRPKARARSRT